MENIRQAIERAKLRREPQRDISVEPARQQSRHVFSDAEEYSQGVQEVELDFGKLQSHRIVAYDGKDPRSLSFDMLRTEVLQSMDLKGWKTLAVTSPTPRCGKTLVAVNLALSIARQRERRVLLADLDLRRPTVASCLGLTRREGVIDVIEKRIELREAIVNVRVGDCNLEILPTTPALSTSDLISSRETARMLDRIKDSSPSSIEILDLPPLLTGPDVISILPRVDCVLLVAAVGTTKKSDIKECGKYLEGTEVVRFVLNKVPKSTTPYVYY
jgi:protein-tyrosine kinase